MKAPGFYIKEFEARGENVTSAHLSFSKGCNAIIGDSDTGKTTLFKIIEYVLGKNSPLQLPPQGVGYNTFYIELNTYDERVYTLMRKVNSNDILVKYCTLSEFHNTSKSYIYSIHSKSQNNISDFLLSISGVTGVLIKKSESKDPIKLSYPMIRHMIFIEEDRIVAGNRSSLFPDDVYTNTTQHKHLIYYLMTGEDDKDFRPKEAPEIRKSRINGRIDYLNTEITSIKSKITEIGDVEYISMSDKQFIDNYRKNLSSLSVSIETLYESLQIKQSQLSEENRDMAELELFISRLQLLLANYEQELKRLEFINHGSTILASLTMPACPLCGSQIAENTKLDFEHVQYCEALQLEYNDINFKIKDITDLISSKVQEHKEKSSFIDSLKREINTINANISNLQPDYEKLENLIQKGEDNLSRKLRLAQLNELLSQKENDLAEAKKQLKKVAQSSKSINTGEYIDNDFLQIIKEVLCEFNFIDEQASVGFDSISFDITINERKRSSYGKGNRSITNAAVQISLLDYCIKKERAFSRLLILDSPICTKYDTLLSTEADGEQPTNNVLDSFARYCNNKTWEYQIILLDNKIDSNDTLDKSRYPNINFIEFGTAERPGLFYTNH